MESDQNPMSLRSDIEKRAKVRPPSIGPPTARITLALVMAISAVVATVAIASGADQEQLSRGQSAYADSCAICHGANLGGGIGPSLVDPGLATKYATAGDLFGFTRASMPQSDPGSLSDAEYLDITAFVVSSLGVQYEGPLTIDGAAGVRLSVESSAPPTTPTAAPTATPGAPIPTPSSEGNTRPGTPRIWEPSPDPTTNEMNPYFISIQTSPYLDADTSDSHVSTEFEIWDAVQNLRVWNALATDPADQASLLTGAFQGPLTGRFGLYNKTVYKVRARHRDSSGDPATEWSDWSPWKVFLTAQQGWYRPRPMRLRDIRPGSLGWFAANGDPVTLAPDNSVLLTGGHSSLLLIEGAESDNRTTDFPPAERHVNLHFRIEAGDSRIVIPESRMDFLDGVGIRRSVWLPFMSLAPGGVLNAAASAAGAFYFEPDNAPIGQADIWPILITRTRSASVPWRVPDGFDLEVVANNLVLPSQIALIPNPSSDPDAPYLYIAELHGTIKVVRRDGGAQVYADALLNFRPGDPPSELTGQVGLGGIVVDPLNGDVYASTVYLKDGQLHNKIQRLESDDGGRTAARRIDILRMENETTGPSHQIYGLLFGGDGKLYAAVGDGLRGGRGLDDNYFAGKILRLNRDGTAPIDNPRYSAEGATLPISYQWSKGHRNNFALTQRPGDAALYSSENGPAIDRLIRAEAGYNAGYDGTDAGVINSGVWFFGPPAISPTGIAFAVGGNFPEERAGRLYMGAYGFNFVEGQVDNGKEIWEIGIGADGEVAEPPATFLKYIGSGRSTVVGVAYGDGGLYFSELFADDPEGGNPVAAGGRVWRIFPKPGLAPR